MINTIYGEMNEDSLIKTNGTEETYEHILSWVEYRQSGSDEIIHRSVNLELKEKAFKIVSILGE
jgi:hypothetical protein